MVEIAPSKQRGMIGSNIQLFLVLGILSVYSLSSFENIHYYDTSLVLVAFVVLFSISMVFFCETPRWLLAHGQKKRAIAVLKFLRGPKYDFKEELETIESTIKKTKQLNARQTLVEFSKCNILIPQTLVLMLAVFRVCGGLESINAFSAIILRNAGVRQFREISVYGTGCVRLRHKLHSGTYCRSYWAKNSLNCKWYWNIHRDYYVRRTFLHNQTFPLCTRDS